MKRRIWMGALAVLLVSSVGTVRADWLIKTYTKPAVGTQIVNYATADALIGGSGLEFSVASPYALSNTQDNGDAGGPFGLGTQVVGLPGPPTDSNDFAFVGIGQVTVAVAGNYTFSTNTDDGSRVRIQINGGGFNQVVTDDVLSGPHTVDSAPVALAAGDVVDFEWMWFERGGGAEGEFWYDRDGGNDVLFGSGRSPDLVLAGAAFTGTVYKSLIIPGITLNNFTDVATVVGTPGTLVGQGTFDTYNILNDTGGNDGDFAGGVNAPGVGFNVDDFVPIGTGFIDIQPGEEGSYIFRSNSDDGARLRIDLNDDGDFDDAGEVVIDDNTLHGPQNIDSAPVTFAEDGYYAVEHFFFERGGGAEGELSVSKVGSGTFALLGDQANGGLDVVQPIPEPSTFVLAGLGLAAFAMLRRRS